MMLEIAIGDAYGRPFEFNTQEFIKANNDVAGYKHRDGEEKTGIGTYTDDTQQSMAIAEQMFSDLPGTQVRFAAHFLAVYKRDPHQGYSKRIKYALEESKLSMPFEFILKAKQAGTNSNGSVMRSVPLGLLSDPKEIMHRCIVQTSASHGHIEAVNASVFVSLTAHFFYHLYPRLDDKTMPEKFAVYETWMKSFMGVNFHDILGSYSLHANPASNETLKCDARTTASLSVKLAWGMISGNTFENVLANTAATNILKKAIAIGGDVDSSASVALGLYSLRHDAVMDLPDALYDNLENGKYGKDYLINMDMELLSKFPRMQKEEKDEKLTDLIA
jgi:ADP-ribosylglycohydrolase